MKTVVRPLLLALVNGGFRRGLMACVVLAALVAGPAHAKRERGYFPDPFGPSSLEDTRGRNREDRSAGDIDARMLRAAINRIEAREGGKLLDARTSPDGSGFIVRWETRDGERVDYYVDGVTGSVRRYGG